MSKLKSITAVLTLGVFAACGGSDAPASSNDQPAVATATPASAPLTDIEMEQGIGPIRDLQLGPLDAELAATGETAFTIKCSACHKIEERYVAPMLGDVLERRRPEYVMNMILNATEMVARHPEAQALLAEFFTPMPIQVTDQAEARAILEYLRSAQVQ